MSNEAAWRPDLHDGEHDELHARIARRVRIGELPRGGGDVYVRCAGDEDGLRRALVG